MIAGNSIKNTNSEGMTLGKMADEAVAGIHLFTKQQLCWQDFSDKVFRKTVVCLKACSFQGKSFPINHG